MHSGRSIPVSAAVFEWFWQNLVFETFKDDLPATHQPAGGARWYVVMKRLIEQPNSHWWDDKTTVQVENRDDMFIRAFKMTVSQMKNEYGRSPKNWPAWGKLHAATFRNQTLGKSGVGLIESLFNRGPVITGGTKSAVNATGWVVGKSFEVNWLPSERLVVDLSDFDKSLTGHTTGQSGHAYHKHYDDMLPMWSKVEYVPMWWQRSSVEADQEGTLRLIP